MRRHILLCLSIPLVCFAAVGILRAQTDTLGFAIGDTSPVDGAGDTLDAPLLIAGEVHGGGGPPDGLYRSELFIQLPARSPAATLNSATLNLYLEDNAAFAGDSTLGTLSIYHDPSRNSQNVNTTDYSDPGYIKIGTFATSNSPPGQYYSFDVTSQIAKDYQNGSSVAAFRFQVDGLAFTGVSRYYRFYYTTCDCAVYPVYLNLSFTAPIAFPPGFGLFQLFGTSAVVHWPTNAANYQLETTGSLSSTQWNAVTNQPFVIGDQFGVFVQTTNTAQFFRLQPQP